MKFTEDDYMMLFNIVVGASLFGLVAGGAMFEELSQLKANSILLQGVFIENQGGGVFNLVSATEGIGILHTNLPLGLVLPVDNCYQLFMNESSRPIRITLEVSSVSMDHCSPTVISQNTTTTTTQTNSAQNQSAYYYKDTEGLHILYHHNPISLNATLLSQIPMNTCYVLIVSLDSSAKQVDVETRPTEQSHCGLP